MQQASAPSRLRCAVEDGYRAIRAQTERLTTGLAAEDQMVQSMTDASPTKWHLAHTTWFFETFILTPQVRGYRPFDPRFAFLFNSYYKQLDGHPNRAVRGTFSRPLLEEVMRYRAHVDRGIGDYLGGDPSPEALGLLELGVHHEQQHQELMVTDIKHAFWTNPLLPPYRGAGASVAVVSAPRPSLPRTWIPFEGGAVEIGHDGAGFAFDNEMPRHREYLRPFHLASRLVTNGEYLEFMQDGGYRRPELWLSEGWDQVCAAGWKAPLYWMPQEDSWSAFTCAGLRRVDWEEPVCHLSYFEAEAFARWAGARLPTETEWEVAAAGAEVQGNFLEDETFHPAAASNPGLQQMFGDVWEWTASPYMAYPGYRAAAGVLGEYNGKFMVNQIVLRGGSCATPRSHIRRSYRNFFPPHARWQFSGIRLADDRS